MFVNGHVNHILPSSDNLVVDSFITHLPLVRHSRYGKSHKRLSTTQQSILCVVWVWVNGDTPHLLCTHICKRPCEECHCLQLDDHLVLIFLYRNGRNCELNLDNVSDPEAGRIHLLKSDICAIRNDVEAMVYRNSPTLFITTRKHVIQYSVVISVEIIAVILGSQEPFGIHQAIEWYRQSEGILIPRREVACAYVDGGVVQKATWGEWFNGSLRKLTRQNLVEILQILYACIEKGGVDASNLYPLFHERPFVLIRTASY